MKEQFGQSAEVISPSVYIEEGGGEILDAGSIYTVNTSNYIEFTIKLDNYEYKSVYDFNANLIYSDYYNKQICSNIKDYFNKKGIVVDKVEVDVNMENGLLGKKK